MKTAQDTFLKYVSGYDPDDPKIRLKADHTLRVADLSRKIAQSLGEDETPGGYGQPGDHPGNDIRVDPELAYLVGILHDIGRFEQVRIYHTFLDRFSIDHACLSADLLFHDGLIRTYPAREEDYPLIEKAIRLHNVYALPEDLNEKEKAYCQILRDADKIDILRVNVESSLEEIYNMPEEAFFTSEITDRVFEDILAHRNVNHVYKKTAIDYLIGHIAFVFGLVYPMSFRIVQEQGYLEKMLGLESRNEKTRERMDRIRPEVHGYMEAHMGYPV